MGGKRELTTQLFLKVAEYEVDEYINIQFMSYSKLFAPVKGSTRWTYNTKLR